MKINERLRLAIDAKRGNLARIAKNTGLSLEGVRKIADGRTANPGIYTVQRIEAALDQLEAAETTSSAAQAPAHARPE